MPLKLPTLPLTLPLKLPTFPFKFPEMLAEPIDTAPEKLPLVTDISEAVMLPGLPVVV